MTQNFCSSMTETSEEARSEKINGTSPQQAYLARRAIREADKAR